MTPQTVSPKQGATTVGTGKDSKMSNVTGDLVRHGTRELVHDAAMQVKLPAAVKKVLEDMGKEKGVTASAVVREALAEYLERRGY